MDFYMIPFYFYSLVHDKFSPLSNPRRKSLDLFTNLEIGYHPKIMALPSQFSTHTFEAGIDEAGRGCLAGPVVAAAVILPKNYSHPVLNDSKKLSHKKRMEIRVDVIRDAIAYGIGIISPQRIDKVNILNATYEAMHQAIKNLKQTPEFLVIDGKYYKPDGETPYECIIKGDSSYLNIAAASILAKTERDTIMMKLSEEFPQYQWKNNKGYPTKAHKIAIRDHGPTKHHRRSFNWSLPLTLF